MPTLFSRPLHTHQGPAGGVRRDSRPLTHALPHTRVQRALLGGKGRRGLASPGLARARVSDLYSSREAQRESPGLAMSPRPNRVRRPSAHAGLTITPAAAVRTLLSRHRQKERAAVGPSRHVNAKKTDHRAGALASAQPLPAKGGWPHQRAPLFVSCALRRPLTRGPGGGRKEQLFLGFSRPSA